LSVKQEKQQVLFAASCRWYDPIENLIQPLFVGKRYTGYKARKCFFQIAFELLSPLLQLKRNAN